MSDVNGVRASADDRGDRGVGDVGDVGNDGDGGRWASALAHRGGTDFWRGLDELLDTPEFRARLAREFPDRATIPAEAWSRRSFLKLLGASVALAGAGACINVPDERLLPYVDQPPEATPGTVRYYATSMTVGGLATGLLAESHVGRPTKLEGNPLHPASLGAAGVYEQASLLQLYDPDRLRGVRHGGRRASWQQFASEFITPAARRQDGGAGLLLVVGPTSSPLEMALLARLRQRFPAVHVHFHDPLAPVGALEGARRAFGAPLLPRHDLDGADVLVLVESDLLGSSPFHLRHARQAAGRRRMLDPADSMSRIHAAESAPSVSGTLADERLRARAGEMPRLLAALLAAVGGAPAGRAAVPEDGRERGWVDAAARDLLAARGRSLVAVGERQPWHAHVLAHAINARLGNVGRTVAYAPSVIAEAGGRSHDPAALAELLRGGAVDTLLVAGANPAYSAPGELELGRLMAAVPNAACMSMYVDETARLCGWVVPHAHYLEAWGDARAYDGTVSLVQPLIQPLWEGRTLAELLAMLLDEQPDGRTLIREHWRGAGLPGDDAWERALQRGIVDSTETATSAPALAAGVEEAAVAAAMATPARASGMEVVFRQDASVRAGEFANNAWLQELPDPLTKLTWGNAAQLSPATAARLGVEAGDVLRLSLAGRELEMPAIVLPGHADESVSVHFGYGREGEERVARGVGVDVYGLWPAGAPPFAAGLAVERVAGKHVPLATTQEHWSMEQRPAALAATLEEYRANPDFARPQRGRQLSLYEPYAYDQGDQWAMVVDLSACIGCSACVVACQAENNVPVVGAEQVRRSREMHWIRVDRYFGGDPEDPSVTLQPMLCQHCENAPCEYVCPVNATVHSPDGLNEMTYNRCVGTRFCSNNCPYKVRRFNWFDYNAELGETERLARNPDVTVRERGVMEKCTFCVQRIRRAQQAAQVEGRKLAPGEVVTACQQTCPTQAITFGSLTNPTDDLLQRMAARRRYAALHELGTRPRVNYLARIDNPAPTPPVADARGVDARGVDAPSADTATGTTPAGGGGQA